MEDNVLPPKKNKYSNRKSGNQKRKNSKRSEAPKGFNIQEVPSPSDDPDTDVEKGGTIDFGKPLDPLERLERLEKMRTRKHLTYSIVSLSIVWILVGIIHYILTGNTFLLVASSPIGGPILIIIGYYFGDQLLQKYIHRGP